MSEQSVINAFYYVCYPPPMMYRHPSAQVHGAKVVKKSEIDKESKEKDDFLHLINVRKRKRLQKCRRNARL